MRQAKARGTDDICLWEVAMSGVLVPGIRLRSRRYGVSPAGRRCLDLLTASTVLIIGAVGAGVMFYHLQFGVIRENFGYFMKGLAESWRLAGACFGLGMACGGILAVGRVSRLLPLRWLCSMYIELFRDIPQLMVVFWVYFLVPAISGRSVNAYLAAVLALTACATAYLAEVIRAGIQSVPGGEMEAALSTGQTYIQAMRWIVLPQALRNMMPSLVNQFVSLFKTTSLVYIIGVVEFFRAATIVNNRDFKSAEVFTFVGLVYFVNCYSVSCLARWWERRLSARKGAAGGIRDVAS